MPGKKQKSTGSSEVQQLVSQMTQLMSRLPSVPVKKNKKKRSKRAKGDAPGPNSRSNQVGSQNDGRCTISRRELVCTLTGNSTAAQCFPMHPVAAHFGYLKVLSEVFGRYSWLRARFVYHSLSGANTDGGVILGWDSDFSYSTASTRAQIARTMPVMDFPVWDNTRPSLVIPPTLLRGSGGIGAHFDLTDPPGTKPSEQESPGQLIVQQVGKGSGEIWIEYTIEFIGMRG